jgi:aryl-alcohol dehydrogenase-like predicted oxidoreductase
MDYRPLGRTGLKVSALCLGTMTWGQQNTEAEGFEQMDYALENGINFFDTAELYSIPPMRETQGSTETIIGNWFASRKNRDKVILATKVVGRTEMGWFRADGSKGRLSKAQMVEAVNASLKRLKTDYIDLYQLHWPDRIVPWGANPTRFSPQDYTITPDEISITEQLEGLDALKKAGKIRHIGLSNESAWGTMRFLFESEKRDLPRVASVQNCYNLINRTYETAMSEIWLREAVGLLAYSPLAQGFLSGKYLDGARPAGARNTLFGRGQRYEKPGSEAAIKHYLALARELGMDGAQFALAFVTSRCFVTSNIIGATSMAQLKSDLQSVKIVITPEIEAKIDAIHQLTGNPAP